MAFRPLTALFLLLAAIAPAKLLAQTDVVRDGKTVTIATSRDAFEVGDASITFRVAQADILPDYQDNALQLERLAECIERFRMNIDSVTIIAFASPEGRYAFNQKLSARRASALHNYLLETWPDVSFGTVREFAGGPDFKGLAALLEDDPDVPFKDEVMALVRKWDVAPEATFRRLMTLRDGEPYEYIREKYLPWQRIATTVIIHYDRHVSLYEKRDSMTVTVVPFESHTSGQMVDSAPAVTASAPDTVGGAVSVYVPPVNAGSADAGGLLPPVASGSDILPPAVSGDAGILPPGLTDTASVIPVTPRYVVEDPIAKTVEARPEQTKKEEKAKREEKARKEEKPRKEENASREERRSSGEIAPIEQSGREPGQTRRQREPRQPRQPREPRQSSTTPFLEGQVPVAAFSTNLLFDAVTAVNFAMELPLADRFTMKVEGIFPWWTWNDQANAFQINHGNIGVRYWFGEREFKGWYGGGALGIGRYDIEPRTNGWRGWEGMVTLGGGYAVPLSDHFVLDLGLGLGSMYTKFDKYEEITEGFRAVTEADKQYLFFGPTDLHISLIYVFTRNR